MEMPGVLLKCFLTKNISTCANKRIPRKALKRKFFLSSGKNINSFLLFVLTLIEREMLFVRRARRWGLEKPICKTESHDDSKTISWHAAFPVRFARLFAALRLNSPLRGSDKWTIPKKVLEHLINHSEDQSDENSSDHRSDTYGIELTGETPRFDFTDIQTLSVIIKSPAMVWLSTNEKSMRKFLVKHICTWWK